MWRRDFIALLGGTALSAPRAARAQEVGRVYRLGVLSGIRRDSPGFAALFDELRQQGFVEGGNLSVDPQGYGVAVEHQEAVAAAVVSAGPDAIVCTGGDLTRAVQRATQTVPILTISGDFVALGLVGSLGRPDRNTTGVSIFATELDIKRQEILMELVPGVRRIAALADPGAEGPGHIQALQDAARSYGVELTIHHARTPEEIAHAVEAARMASAQALNVLASPAFNANRAVIIERVAAARLPTMYQWPDIAADGGLIAYGAQTASVYRQLAVLRGTRTADISVEQPTRIELVINLRTANALGLTVPPALLARADEVIE